MYHCAKLSNGRYDDKGYRSWRRELSLRVEMIKRSLRKKYSDSPLEIRRTEIKMCQLPWKDNHSMLLNGGGGGEQGP